MLVLLYKYQVSSYRYKFPVTRQVARLSSFCLYVIEAVKQCWPFTPSTTFKVTTLLLVSFNDSTLCLKKPDL